MKTYIAYLRQSTMKQQISGLGVEAQREIIHNHVKNKPILAEYIETESGKKSNRPQLLAALAMCRKTNSILIVAKLDSLNSATHIVRNKFKILSNNILPSILPCQKIHLT